MCGSFSFGMMIGTSAYKNHPSKQKTSKSPIPLNQFFLVHTAISAFNAFPF